MRFFKEKNDIGENPEVKNQILQTPEKDKMTPTEAGKEKLFPRQSFENRIKVNPANHPENSEGNGKLNLGKKAEGNNSAEDTYKEERQLQLGKGNLEAKQPMIKKSDGMER